MKKWHCGLFSVFMLIGTVLPVKAENDLSNLIVSTQPTKNVNELVQNSSLIVYRTYGRKAHGFNREMKVRIFYG